MKGDNSDWGVATLVWMLPSLGYPLSWFLKEVTYTGELQHWSEFSLSGVSIILFTLLFTIILMNKLLTVHTVKYSFVCNSSWDLVTSTVKPIKTNRTFNHENTIHEWHSEMAEYINSLFLLIIDRTFWWWYWEHCQFFTVKAKSQMFSHNTLVIIHWTWVFSADKTSCHCHSKKATIRFTSLSLYRWPLNDHVWWTGVEQHC